MIEPDKNNPQLPSCINHPDQEATGACCKCGKPLCDKCSEWFRSKLYCIPCYTEAELMFAASEIPDNDKQEWYEKTGNHAAFIILGVMLMLGGILGAKFLSHIAGWVIWGIGCLGEIVTSGLVIINKVYDRSTKVCLVAFVLVVSLLFLIMFIGN